MAATTFQSDDSGGGLVKCPSSQGHSQISNLVSGLCSPSTVPQIVRDDFGSEGQASDSSGVGGSDASRKPVWNKPSNGGVVEAVSPVMGAVSWPALGESTKGSPKSSSSESLKALADGPPPSALHMVAENSSPSSDKQTTATNMRPTSTQNHVAPARQRSMKRGGGSLNSNVSANGGVSHMSATKQDSVVENQHSTSGKPGTAPAESSPRGNKHIESQRGGVGSQSFNSNEHQHQRNTYRRSNSGQYHHSYGGKREQDRVNHEWNQHSRSFNGRDTQMHTQRGYPRGYIRPSVHTSASFVPPPMPLPVQSFGNNMMYHDLPSPVFYVQGPPPPPEALRAMTPLVGPIPPPFYFAVPDPLLHSRIVSQIDYYFSNENLVKDTYLRKNMDEQGWVPVSLIASFKKVLNLTDNIQLILDAMRSSNIVEVQGDKIRRRNDWMKWLMQPLAQSAGRSSNQDVWISQLQGVTLDDVASTNQDSAENYFGEEKVVNKQY